MHPTTRMRKSRDSWRKKAVERSREIRNMSKRDSRQSETIARLETERQKLVEQLTEARSAGAIIPPELAVAEKKTPKCSASCW